MSLLARRLLFTGSEVAAFDPVDDIAWHTAYWAEGDSFAALGLADGAAVSTMPDETGTGFGSATQGTASARPTYRAADANFNSQPCIDGDGGDWLRTATGTAIGQPCTVVLVGKSSATGQRLVDGAGGGAYQGMLYRSTGAAVNYHWMVYAPSGAGSSIPSDSSTHLFIIELNGSSSSLQVDGTTATGLNPGTNSPSGVTLLNDYAANSAADKFAFYGLISGTLTADEKADLLAWAREHYGTP